MSWFSPILLTRDDRNTSAQLSADALRMPARTNAAPSLGLGSARASGQWAWADASARPAVAARPVVTAREGASLRAPVELLSQMAEAAKAMGRSESDVWVEAAREWLRRRELAPVAPPAAPAYGAPPRRVARVWDDIDALLIDLRAPATSREHEGAPAA